MRVLINNIYQALIYNSLFFKGGIYNYIWGAFVFVIPLLALCLFCAGGAGRLGAVCGNCMAAGCLSDPGCCRNDLGAAFLLSCPASLFPLVPFVLRFCFCVCLCFCPLPCRAALLFLFYPLSSLFFYIIFLFFYFHTKTFIHYMQTCSIYVYYGPFYVPFYTCFSCFCINFIHKLKNS